MRLLPSIVRARHLTSLPLLPALALAVAVPAITWAPKARGGAIPAWAMDLPDVKVGAKGYGLTVMKGTEPEKFDVEVVGILTKFRPGQDLILIKTPHERLNIAHTVAGMSGSPIFLDGKMIGAYAYGWQFGAEPIAGVTPIKNMLDDLARPIPANLLKPIPEPPPKSREPLKKAAGRRGVKKADNDPYGRPFEGDVMEYDVRAHGKQITAAVGDLRKAPSDSKLLPTTTSLIVGGLSDRMMRHLTEAVAPMGYETLQGGGAGSGAQDPSAPTKYVDGGAITVQLVRGDVGMQGLGTVTRVEGDKLVAFGHPMQHGGISALPTAIGKVHWIMASQARSFKIGEPARPLGTMVNDLQASIVIDTKVDAPTFPVNITVTGVDGAPKTSWKMEVAHERFMAPVFMAVALGNAVESTVSERRDATWTAKTTVTIKGYGDIELDDFGLSIGGTPDANDFFRSRATRAVGIALNNPWEWAQVEKVDMKLKIEWGRNLWSMKGASVDEDSVVAGEKVRIKVKLEQFNGADEIRTIEVPIARELAGRDVDIQLVPGWMDGPEVPFPDSLRSILDSLPKMSFAPDQLIAVYRLPDGGVAKGANVVRRLPASLLDTLKSQGPDAPDSFPSVARHAFPMGKFVDGRAFVRVRVKEPAK